MISSGNIPSHLSKSVESPSMSSSIDATTTAPSPAAVRQTTFLPGVGEVPSGPRTSFEPFRLGRARTTVETFRNTSVQIKEEDTGPNRSSDPAAEEGEVIQNGDIKQEAPSESMRPSDLDLGYQTMFLRLLAESERNSRSDTTGSRRQDTNEGRRSRSERLASSRASNRSRSPQRSGSSNYTSSRGSRDSPMFYPGSQARIDLYPDTYIPEHSILRRRDPGPAAETTQRPPPPQQSLPLQDPSSSPSLTTSLSSSRPFSSTPQTRLISSSTEPSPPAEETEGEDRRCRCPIGYICRNRPRDHLECRPLVRERMTWREREDQEAFER